MLAFDPFSGSLEQPRVFRVTAVGGSVFWPGSIDGLACLVERDADLRLVADLVTILDVFTIFGGLGSSSSFC